MHFTLWCVYKVAKTTLCTDWRRTRDDGRTWIIKREDGKYLASVHTRMKMCTWMIHEITVQIV